MPAAISNRLLPLLAGAVVVMLVFVALSQSLSQTRTSTGSSEIPIGLGLDGLDGELGLSDELVWSESLDAREPLSTGSGGPGLLQGTGCSAGGLLSTTREQTGALAGQLQAQLPKTGTRPVFTVPRNATLIGSTAMTALVGRVPVQGQVRDPRLSHATPFDPHRRARLD